MIYTEMKSELARNILKTIFIIILLSSAIYISHSGSFWRFLWIVLDIFSVIRLYDDFNSFKKIIITEKKEKEKTFNNYRTKNSYKAPIKRKNGFTITEAYELFKLDMNSDEATIKNKFRELAKKWHPDIFATDTDENKKIAERNFQKVINAYEIIKYYKGMK